MTDATDRELVIRDLRVAPAAKPDHEILQGINLTIRKGETHAIMGPNGSGKTTLSYALMGHPAYVVKSGEVLWKGRNLLDLSADKRARLGLFLAFQYPTAIPGLSVASFIRSARCTVNLLWIKVRDAIADTLDSLTLADLVPVRHIVLDPREPATSRAGLA